MCGKFSLLFVALSVIINTCYVTSVSVNSVFRTHSALPIPGGMSPSIIESATSGTFLALEYCQNVFQWDRWNCPREEFNRHSNQSPNREAAFTKAIIAAGIVHSITKNCSRGEIRDCSCNPRIEDSSLRPPQYSQYYENITVVAANILLNKTKASDKTVSWSWGGCSDDTSFGVKIARNLLENSGKKLSPLAYVGRHNYRVGREVVRQSMVKKCRCHGVSGSCSLQTCWLQIAPFQYIARKLREKYNKAARLTADSIEASISLTNSIKREEKEKLLPAPEHILVYLEQSPDYCVPNASQNWPGTKGRCCSKTKSDLATLSEKKVVETSVDNVATK